MNNLDSEHLFRLSSYTTCPFILQTSSSGQDFSIWRLTDLRGDLSLPGVSLFLFGAAHRSHWKMPLNRVVGILNPKHLGIKPYIPSSSRLGLHQILAIRARVSAVWVMTENGRNYVGIMTCAVEDRGGAGRKGEVSLSVDHPEKLLELGESTDLGRCEQTKKDGARCTNIVNRTSCNFCVHHLKTAYKSAAGGRAALQSSYR